MAEGTDSNTATMLISFLVSGFILAMFAILYYMNKQEEKADALRRATDPEYGREDDAKSKGKRRSRGGRGLKYVTTTEKALEKDLALKGKLVARVHRRIRDHHDYYLESMKYEKEFERVRAQWEAEYKSEQAPAVTYNVKELPKTMLVEKPANVEFRFTATILGVYEHKPKHGFNCIVLNRTAFHVSKNADPRSHDPLREHGVIKVGNSRLHVVHSFLHNKRVLHLLAYPVEDPYALVGQDVHVTVALGSYDNTDAAVVYDDEYIPEEGEMVVPVNPVDVTDEQLRDEENLFKELGMDSTTANVQRGKVQVIKDIEAFKKSVAEGKRRFDSIADDDAKMIEMGLYLPPLPGQMEAKKAEIEDHMELATASAKHKRTASLRRIEMRKNSTFLRAPVAVRDRTIAYAIYRKDADLSLFKTADERAAEELRAQREEQRKLRDVARERRRQQRIAIVGGTPRMSGTSQPQPQPQPRPQPLSQPGGYGYGSAQQPQSAVYGSAQQPQSAVYGSAQQPQSAVYGSAQQPQSAVYGSAQQPQYASAQSDAYGGAPMGAGMFDQPQHNNHNATFNGAPYAPASQPAAPYSSAPAAGPAADSYHNAAFSRADAYSAYAPAQ